MQLIEYLAILMLAIIFGMMASILVSPPRNFHGPVALEETKKIHQTGDRKYRFIIKREK